MTILVEYGNCCTSVVFLGLNIDWWACFGPNWTQIGSNIAPKCYFSYIMDRNCFQPRQTIYQWVILTNKDTVAQFTCIIGVIGVISTHKTRILVPKLGPKCYYCTKWIRIPPSLSKREYKCILLVNSCSLMHVTCITTRIFSCGDPKILISGPETGPKYRFSKIMKQNSF